MFCVIKVSGGVISVLVVFWDGSIVGLSNYFCSYLLLAFCPNVLHGVFSCYTIVFFTPHYVYNHLDLLLGNPCE